MQLSSLNLAPLLTGSRLPVLAQSPVPNGNLLDIAANSRRQVTDLLLKHGAILFRGFNVDRASFCEFVDTVGGDRLNYTYRSTPRTSVADRLYTATNYPSDREIPLHCENAYQSEWPLLVAFYCEQPALEGGETPLADIIKVTERIGDRLLDQFRRRKVRYVRNYTDGVDLQWTEVFQTESLSDVEHFCKEHNIELTLGQGDSFRTAQTCQGTAIHPRLNIELWFNQAHLFHVSSFGPKFAQDMIDAFGWEGLPRNATYGDGAEISPEDLKSIRDAFKAETVMFGWQKNDLLLVDNMQVAHGRRPYVGPRTVLVAMSNADVFPPI